MLGISVEPSTHHAGRRLSALLLFVAACGVAVATWATGYFVTRSLHAAEPMTGHSSQASSAGSFNRVPVGHSVPKPWRSPRSVRQQGGLGPRQQAMVPHIDNAAASPVPSIQRVSYEAPFTVYRDAGRVTPVAAAFEEPIHADPIESPTTEPSLFDVEGIETIDLAGIRNLALAHSREVTIVQFQRDEAVTEIDVADSRFDPSFGVGITTGVFDQQVQSIIQSFGATSAIQKSFFVNPLENDQIFLERRTRGGGLSRIGLSSNYLSLEPADEAVFVNPGFDSRLRFRLEQPLMRGGGYDVNAQPIFIAKKRADMSEFAFQASVNQLLRRVELAYWTWERDYKLVELFAANEQRRREIWEREAGLLELGRGTIPAEAQALEAYQNARLQAAQSLNTAARSELVLYRVAGLPPKFDSLSVPGDDSETPREFIRDVHEAMAGAETRPELMAQQAAVDVACAQIRIAENQFRPDLSVILDYSTLGLADGIDDSFSTLGDFRFYNWTAGVRFASPIYRRGERARLTRANTEELRTRLTFEQLRHVLIHDASEAHSRVIALEAQIDVHHERMEAAERELEARTTLYENSKADLIEVMDAEDRLLQARVDYQVALADFQRSITTLNFTSGRIMESHWIVPADDVAVDENVASRADLAPSPAIPSKEQAPSREPVTPSEQPIPPLPGHSVTPKRAAAVPREQMLPF